MNKSLAKQLFEKVSHGDQEHQDWLEEAIHNFFEGKEVPEPRGSGTKDRLYKEIKRLEEENKQLKERLRNDDTIGLCGSGIASADEVINATNNQKK